jgi:hypothetical protein
LRHGIRIGVDVGDARIGIAQSDPSGLIATTVETVRRGAGDLARIAAITAEADAVEVVAWNSPQGPAPPLRTSVLMGRRSNLSGLSL